MNKLGNRPVKILEKTPLNQFRWTSSSTKVFLATAGTLFALSATMVICLIAFSTHRPKRSGSNGSVGVPVPPATKVITPAEKGNGSVVPLPETNQADPGTIATQHSAIDQTPTPPVNPIPTPAPVPQPESKAFTSDSELLRGERPEFGPKKVERQLPKSVRKNLENERREAERKRSRLEDMYQRHLITSEAYKKGEFGAKGMWWRGFIGVPMLSALACNKQKPPWPRNMSCPPRTTPRTVAPFRWA